MSYFSNQHESLLDLELFADCTRAQIARVRSLLTMLTVDAGSVLIKEGTYGLEFLIIAEGEARVSVNTSDGDLVLAHLGAGDFMGEMSLLARDRRSATVTATTPLVFYVCNAAEFAGILEAAPSVAEKITRTAAERRTANLRTLGKAA